MSSSADKPSTTRRRHDSEATRQALLEAARELFDEVGYDHATTREIGERAGVDPALIARYFDSKEGLFLAAIAAGPSDEGQQIDPDPVGALALLLERWGGHGHSPIARAMASPTLSEEVLGQVRTVLGGRIVGPIAAELSSGDAGDATLRAELLVALALGVAVTRANGTLESLAAVPQERLVALLGPLVQHLASA